MDPSDPIIEILRQINELSGAALNALLQGAPEGEGAPPAGGPDEGGAVPAPPGQGQ